MTTTELILSNDGCDIMRPTGSERVEKTEGMPLKMIRTEELIDLWISGDNFECLPFSMHYCTARGHPSLFYDNFNKGQERYSKETEDLINKK